MYGKGATGKVSAAVLLTLGSLQASAQESFDLGRVEVMAESELPAAGRVAVDAGKMREDNLETVDEALERLPGVTVGTRGARNEAVVFLRGFDMRQVPLYIDGIPVYVPYDGYIDLGRFTTYDLAEINVAKGYSSVLYGSNTLGGAINLVSRRPSKEFEGELGAGYVTGEDSGSDGTRGWVNLGSNQGAWYLQFSASYLDQDAYSLSDDFDPVPTEDGGLRENAYREDRKVSFKLGLTPNATDEYAFGYVKQEGEKGTPPYAGDGDTSARYWQWPYWDKESFYLLSKTVFSDDSYLKGRLYYDIFENSLYSYDDDSYTTQRRGYAFKSWYDDYTYGGSLEYGKSLGRHRLAAAAHYKLDHHEEHNAGDPVQTFEDLTLSFALEDRIDLGQDRYLVAGLSYDIRDSREAEDYSTGTLTDHADNDGSAWNPQIGYFARLGPADDARLTLSHKTRFPTIKDRYSYRLGSALPNPDLDPEKATTLEAGWVHRFGETARLDSALFYSDIRDLIQEVDLDPDTYQLQNIGKVRSMGLDLALEAWIGDSVELGGHYSYLYRDNRSSDLKLTDVPDHKLFTYATAHVNDLWSLSLDLQHESERYSSSDGENKAKGFTLLGAHTAYELYPGLKAKLGVRNLTDRDYVYQEGFPEPGRTWYADINYRF